MAKTIDDLYELYENIYNTVLQIAVNNKPVTEKADLASNKIPQVDTNTTDIQANSEDIVETQIGLAETYEETNNGITQCEIAITEIYEMLMPTE